MSEQLLTLLKLCLLILVYLFFFRVLRAVWVETRPEGSVGRRRREGSARATSGGPAPSAPANGRLVVIEPPEQRGRVYELSNELTVGRAAGCEITIDDTYVSQMHTRIFTTDGQRLVEDLGSTNGTYLNRQKVTSPMVMRTGDRLQIGDTVLEMT